MLKNGNSKKEESNPEIVEKNSTTVSYLSDKKKDHQPNKLSRTHGEKNGVRTDKSDSLLTRRTKLLEECAEFSTLPQSQLHEQSNENNISLNLYIKISQTSLFC